MLAHSPDKYIISTPCYVYITRNLDKPIINLRTVAALCVEDLVAPPCFEIVSVNIVVRSINTSSPRLDYISQFRRLWCGNDAVEGVLFELLRSSLPNIILIPSDEHDSKFQESSLKQHQISDAAQPQSEVARLQYTGETSGNRTCGEDVLQGVEKSVIAARLDVRLVRHVLGTIEEFGNHQRSDLIPIDSRRRRVLMTGIRQRTLRCVNLRQNLMSVSREEFTETHAVQFVRACVGDAPCTMGLLEHVIRRTNNNSGQAEANSNVQVMFPLKRVFLAFALTVLCLSVPLWKVTE
ncbi:hypothetical protein J6590_064551 [Homalodisca vitripennis]|nr:hypothetical protein J6590_064551 [Homalodisca vitripennis]